MIDEKGYSISQVAAILGIAVSTTRKKCDEGSIPFLKVGKRICFPKVIFDRWMMVRILSSVNDSERKFLIQGNSDDERVDEGYDR